MILFVIVCLAALVLDRLVGEPRRCHPLVGLGWCVDQLETRFNRNGKGGITAGALAVVILLLPFLGVSFLLSLLPAIPWVIVSTVVLWLCIGHRSLAEHGMAVYRPLVSGDLTGARERVGMMVSRDPRALDETGIATATTESLLENGADAVFASLFWFLVAGLPGLILHRVANTLDAMWGYRSQRFNRFGRVAARLDDALNWIPARLTALGYALAGRTRLALRCWKTQAPEWESPNAGPVMAAGAGALGVQLGGGAPYHEGWRERPVLGSGKSATAETIPEAVALIRRSLLLWLAAAVVIMVVVESLGWGIL
ncbi:adenosylcobinamide-phosphate synthase [Halospina denitrificans]|uniref:Cobalamin biosynthesis protein CobD n=1 Tax=Halospina denitrificans TaxID=332522 RepID=A0A4R7K1T1_9GAMM|nr:adenosylcobinamide-phosphate synthase CbiB [Halospina denitrificans]TDT44416.1 adenosylcobinamide-phosphate synthase [Halospina denitrificans]